MKQLPEDILKKIEEHFTQYETMWAAKRIGAEFGYHLGVEQAASQFQPTGIDIYSGDLNSKRIEAYRKLAKEYGISESSVRDIFCKGADFYKSILKMRSSKKEIEQ